jgi:DNA modification methylase
MLDEARGYQTDAILRFTRPQRDYTGELKRVHPCQKPLGLYQTIIARTPGEIVLDWFVGSGTVAMAAASLGRRWIAFELNPETAHVARQRLGWVQPFIPQLIPVPNQKELFAQAS